MDPTPPKISVIVPAYNEEEFLPGCLSRLVKQETKVPYEIIVVDNNSTDGTVQIASQYPEKVRVVPEQRQGLTWTRQAGFEAAKAETLAYIDADTLAPVDWIETIQKTIEKYPQAVALKGKFRYRVKSIIHKAMLWFFFTFVERIINLLTQGQRVVGMHFVVRRDSLVKIGGFNHEVAFYGEDVDLAVRLQKIGKIYPLNATVLTSGRRFDNQGMLIPGFIYLFNSFWIRMFKKPFFNFYADSKAKGPSTG